ncbi:hypothetical protein GGE65_007275 [Skermanella aerolata]|uniref:hypothetical protein n=1 Tax=Skermanella aerolata TaxID=393310 RepID=UPI003D225934
MFRRKDDYDGWVISLPTFPEEKAQAQKGYKALALAVFGAVLLLAAPWTLTTSFAHLSAAAIVGYCTGFLLMDGLRRVFWHREYINYQP